MLGEKQQSGNTETLSTHWCGPLSTHWCGPLSYASVVMMARDSQCDWKERQQRVLHDAASGNYR